MTYEECMASPKITKVLDEVTITRLGVKHTITRGYESGRLEVVELVKYNQGKTSRNGCICKCKCGNYIGPSLLYSLFNGDLISCGCYCRDVHSNMLKEYNTKHGMSVRGHRDKLYTVWAAMKDRALNKNRQDAKYYANKEIGIDNDWLDFVKFADWALNNGYEEGLSIDRIDNSKGYYPENCRFIEVSKQNSNKTNNRQLEYNGEIHNIMEWCEITGRCWSTVDRALKAGKTVGQALGYED